MRRAALAMVLTLIATAAAAQHSKRGTAAFAEPGDIIAAEGNFTHLSAAKGPRAAIHATAAPDAQIFAPQLMSVADYAKNATDLQLTTPWHTRELWMSCDGSYAVTHGVWQRAPAVGWTITIWHRQKGGGYKWVLNESGALTAPPAESDMIAASVADCPLRRPHPNPAAEQTATAKPVAIDYASHSADDGTMAWATASAPDGNHSFSLQLKQNGSMHEVLHVPSAAR